MLTYSRAETIAVGFVATRCGHGKAVLLPERMIVRAYGWIFHYQSAEYVRTGNQMAMLLGNAPFLVGRADGRIMEKDKRETMQQFLTRCEATLGSEGADSAPER